jgi:ATP-dependent protease ClpP protease subunit
MLNNLKSAIQLLLVFVVAITLSLSITYCKARSSANAQKTVTTMLANGQRTKIVPDIIEPTPQTKDVPVEVIQLSAKNTVVMDQVFTDESVGKVMREIKELSVNLKKSDVIYLVLNTPGGSIDSGNSLIAFIKGLPQETKTLSIFSASMGFQTAQNLGERLVLPNSTVMSHRAKFGVKGEGPGELFSELKFIMSMIDGLDHVAAARMKLSFDDYRALVADEYWAYGANAVQEYSADRMVLAQCASDLSGTKFITVETMIGPFTVELSKCPLIPGMISFKANNANATEEQIQYVKKMFLDKRAFLEDYVITNNWTKFQK